MMGIAGRKVKKRKRKIVRRMADMENLYCTDLDGTIICNKTADGCVVVAKKHNVPSSFMYPQSLAALDEILTRIDVLPVTTRCLKSYQNVCIKDKFRFALVDNGARLVCGNNELEKEWEEESRRIASASKENFDKARVLIEGCGCKEKWGSEFVLDYVTDRCMAGSELARNLIQMTDLSVNIKADGIIVTNRSLSKGECIKRFAEKFQYCLFLSSGDSAEDESMYGVTKHSIGSEGAEFEIHEKYGLSYCYMVLMQALSLVA